MRVISGSVRGLKLNTPTNNDIRPTTDRVKEAMFNVIASEIYDSIVFDMFSGSGALGIEALSRGAKKSYFCDKNRQSIEVLKKNIEKTRFEDRSNVTVGDYKVAIDMLKKNNIRCNLIFVDPPYYEGYFEEVLKSIVENEILEDDGVIVVEHDAKTDIPEIFGLEKFKEKKYGITKLSFYTLEEDDEL